MNELELLREEVLRLSRQVDAQQAHRRSRSRALFVVAVTGALVSAVAAAAEYDCSTGPLGRGLFCFQPDQPAIANRLNGNFYELSSAIDAGEGRNGVQDSRLALLEARVSTLEADVTALKVGERVVSGIRTFSNPSCASAASPCSISFPAGSFTAAPRCVITMQNIDGTEYQEHMVIKSVSTTSFEIWEGRYYNAGTTMTVFWVCSGR